MRVLLIHNFYQQSGGEDVAFVAEGALLKDHGHQVIEYTDTNKRISEIGSLALAGQTIWSWSTYRKISTLLTESSPQVAHFHNTFPLISPSAYYACQRAGVPVVQSLHNFRLMCPVAVLYRDGSVCEDCLARTVAWPSVLHKCYHGSRIETSVVAGMLAFHRAMWTWQRRVDVYVTLTEFSRRKFIEAGLPPEKLWVKPNFAPESKPLASASPGEFVLFIGRLSPEKGIQTLLAAWEHLDFRLKVVGEGTFRERVQGVAERSQSVEYIGQLSREAVVELMLQARFLVFPSEWYEGLPFVITEAFSCGKPVLSSDLGSQAEVVVSGFSGLHFRAGDAADLADKARWLWDHPGESARMGRNARLEYERKYTPERNYRILLEIYEHAIAKGTR